MRLTTLLACTASILAASATFAVAGTASAAVSGAAQQANVSDFLAGQLTRLTGRTTVMVHGSASRRPVTPSLPRAWRRRASSSASAS